MSVQSTVPELFRILILENERPLRESLTKKIGEELPGAVIVQAGTIDEALDVIDRGPVPTLGILDIRVPMREGYNDEANPQVADRLRELGVPCIFMTGYKNTDDVQDFLRKHSLVDPNIVVIEKIIKAGHLKEGIVRHARSLFERLASNNVQGAVKRVFGNGLDSQQSTTAGWIRTERLIREYWRYLDRVTRELVRKWVVVDELPGGEVRLSLFSTDELK
jgi:CheY-like chemotaxis protein